MKEFLIIILVCVISLVCIELVLRIPVFAPLFSDLRMYQENDLLQYGLIPGYEKHYYHPEYYMYIKNAQYRSLTRSRGGHPLLLLSGDSFTNRSLIDFVVSFVFLWKYNGEMGTH